MCRLYRSTVIQYSATKPEEQTQHKAVQSRTSQGIEATEDQERCQLLRSVSTKITQLPCCTASQLRKSSCIHSLTLFRFVSSCLRIQRNQHTQRLGTGVSSWRGSGLTGVLDGETRTGVDPSKAPLQFNAALALSALVNSTNAMRVGWW